MTRGRSIRAAPRKYPDELRDCAVRLYRQSYPKPTIRRLAEQLRVHHEALRTWIRRADKLERQTGRDGRADRANPAGLPRPSELLLPRRTGGFERRRLSRSG